MASGLPTITCPACQASMGLEAILGTDDARGVVDLLARMPGPPTLRKALLRYVGLFAPAKRQIAWGRVEALLAEVVALMESGRVARNGRTYPAPLDYWQAGLDALFAMPSLRRPLKSHGLLLEIIASHADRAEGQAEQVKLTQGRGETPIGRPAQPAPQPKHQPNPRDRAATQAGLASLQAVLAGAPIPTPPGA